MSTSLCGRKGKGGGNGGGGGKCLMGRQGVPPPLRSSTPHTSAASPHEWKAGRALYQGVLGRRVCGQERDGIQLKTNERERGGMRKKGEERSQNLATDIRLTEATELSRSRQSSLSRRPF